MPECPDCGDVLNRLYFNQPVTGNEYGSESFPIGSGNREYDDTDTYGNGDASYRCGNCEYEFNDSEISQMNDEYTEEHPPNNDDNWIPGGYPTVGYQASRPNTNDNEQINPVECPQCNHNYQDEIASEMICPRCSHTWNPPEDEVTAEITINGP